MKPLKLAHSEGHTVVCYDSSGSFILTGGNDGKVCIWEGQDDTDTITVSIGDTIFALAFQGGRFFAATDENAIRVHTFPDGVGDGMVTRFTAPCRHFCISEDGSLLIAGSDDFKIKVISMEENECIFLYTEHQAPVLSVALDPTKEFIASSSCDGSVKIWNVIDGSTEKSLSLLPKYSEPSQAKSLCRICWSKDGEFLLIPLNNEIHVYLRSSWEVVKKISSPNITEAISVMIMCGDGQHLAVGCVGGDIGIFEWQINKLIDKHSHPKRMTIASLAWNPQKPSEVAFTDNMGLLGFLDITVLNKKVMNDDSIPSDLEDDVSVSKAGEDADLDDIDKFLDENDDNSIDIGSIKRSLNPLIDPDDAESVASGKAFEGQSGLPLVPVMPLPDNIFKPTPLQSPFQSGSTPEHLSSRFMVWNSVGLVRQYASDDENTIDVEFHNAATHHALHIDNKVDYVIADLSAQALLLASRGDQDSHTRSKLLCMHFGTWDSHKEWTYEMPEGEEIQTVTLTEKWAAVATSSRMIRIFTVGGMQSQIFTIPGNVVTLTSHESKLLTVYHKGMGIPGDQYMGINVMKVIGGSRSMIIKDDTLPLSPASKLAWIGFSEEGTPVFMDSAGIVRMLNRHFGSTWCPVANTRQHVKGKSDHYWLVSVSERQQQIRCVPCKGSRYPATLPRPALAVLPFQLQMCDMSSEKTQYEESYQRSCLIAGSLEGSGHVDGDELIRPLRESLIKLFAFAAKSERDFRALEVCDLMEDQSLLHIAATYATRLKRIQLAERVSEVMHRQQDCVQQKTTSAQEESEDEDRTDTLYQRHSSQEVENDEDIDVDTDVRLADSGDNRRTSSGPLLKVGIEKEIKVKERTPGRQNPFKMSGSSDKNSTKGSQVFDKMEKARPKASPVLAPLPVTIKKSNKKQTSSQPKLMNFTKEGKKVDSVKKESPTDENLPAVKNEFLSQTSTEEKLENEPVKKKLSGFDLWLEANRNSIRADYPDLSEDDVGQQAEIFRSLTEEERQAWVQKAKALSDQSGHENSKKRKLSSEDGNMTRKSGQDDQKRMKKAESASQGKIVLSQSTNAKLAKFAKTD